ncbi:hypothetical protein ABMX62_19090 [Vibrio vulnificus]|uniref:hypothetical protein n=1 Tax=Vibrio vulnificus TaxID=672 RepID=UPI004057DB4A
MSEPLERVAIKIRAQIIDMIINTVPVSVPNMVYAQVWVLETIATRLENGNPLEVSLDLQFTLPESASAVAAGTVPHHPRLERCAYEITQHFMPVIDSSLGSKEGRIVLVDSIRNII